MLRTLTCLLRSGVLFAVCTLLPYYLSRAVIYFGPIFRRNNPPLVSLLSFTTSPAKSEVDKSALRHHSLAMEERTERFIAEFDRWRAERDKQKHERLMAKAIAMGFSCREEVEKYEWEERLRKEAMRESNMAKAAAAAGKTVEEYRYEVYGQQDFVPKCLLPTMSQCDCEGKYLLFSQMGFF